MRDFWQDRRVFVTGATGLIGGWLVKDLCSLGAEVVALVRDWEPKSMFLSNEMQDNVSVVRGDLSDLGLLQRIINEYEIRSIIHLAAQTIVPIANKNPLSTFESNIRGTWNLLESARGAPLVDSIVVASSDKAYGDVEELPYREDLPLNGVYPYDVSKSCADLICRSYAKTFDLPVSITRCGNFFGGGDLNWNRIVPGTIRSITRGNAPEIRSDGTLIRDYIYVEDAVNAYLLLSMSLSNDDDLKGEAFNFSNDSQVSVLELVETIIKKMSVDIKPIIHNENKGEIKSQYLDSSKAKDRLGWVPKFGLDLGLDRTISWYKELLIGD